MSDSVSDEQRGNRDRYGKNRDFFQGLFRGLLIIVGVDDGLC